MREKKGETVLITYATSGIGYELGRLFAMNGYDLILVDADSSDLKKTSSEWMKKYKVHIETFSQNLSNPDAAEHIYEWTMERQIPIHFMINYADFQLSGSFLETELAQELEMIQVHIATFTAITKLFIKQMAERRKGRILQVASTAAFQPRPKLAVFHATNAFILAFGQALDNEMKDYGVRVNTLCAGPELSQVKWSAREEVPTWLSEVPMSAQNIAEFAFRRFLDEQDKPLIIPGMKNRLLARSVQFMPRKMVTKVVKKMDEGKGESGD
ncbi:short-subunit dehydrogenase [Croceifilum oryzae]|uniref:Short-subunit dehydrogenase n=1 Tax=Croceifilum oryzae TaxID=1553429 RepID=A0AAJ1TC68_9BACL|nr:SDR family NAD(P)-dependent oxidoreductase [Croceifilum oryzae]MDQ0416150.1 short-subunit dehydrogenase [Croceifilum oryzae]